MKKNQSLELQQWKEAMLNAALEIVKEQHCLEAISNLENRCKKRILTEEKRITDCIRHILYHTVKKRGPLDNFLKSKSKVANYENYYDSLSDLIQRMLCDKIDPAYSQFSLEDHIKTKKLWIKIRAEFKKILNDFFKIDVSFGSAPFAKRGQIIFKKQ